MASAYPGSLDNLDTTHTDGVAEIIAASHINDLADAVNKIEAELAANPSGTSFATVKERLDALDIAAFNTQVASYTLVIEDQGKIVGLNAAGANTLTVPPNASVGFPVGAIITLRQVGAGQTTITPGAGVTLNSRGGALKLTGQWAYATLIKTATNTWDVSGDISL